MNLWEFLLGIVIVGAIASVLKARYGVRETKDGDMPIHDPATAADNVRLRDEIRGLKERIQVLERVVTDNESGAHIDREIEKLFLRLR